MKSRSHYLTKRRLARRTFLRGAGGVTLGLPVLEAMLNSHGTAFADDTAIPQRYAIFFMPTHIPGEYANRFVPQTTGSGFAYPAALAALGEFPGLRDYVSVVSGLELPEATPSGWTPPNWHGNALAPLFSGKASSLNDPTGSSSDVIVGDAIGANIALSTLALRCDDMSGKTGANQNMSFRVSGGQVTYAGNFTLDAAYNTAFQNFAPPTDDAGAQERQVEIARRTRMLDAIAEDFRRISARLGQRDQQMLGEHLQQVSELEAAVGNSASAAVEGCAAYALPADTNVSIDRKAEIFGQMLHSAFQCDITRCGSVMLGQGQTAMPANRLPGVTSTRALHDLGHSGLYEGDNLVNLIAAANWGVRQFARFCERLRTTPVGDGNLLDHTGAIFVFESGEGPHSGKGMQMLVAGRAGNLKRQAEHISAAGFSSAVRHPGAVMLAVMQQVAGSSISRLGEVTQAFPGVLDA